MLTCILVSLTEALMYSRGDSEVNTSRPRSEILL